MECANCGKEVFPVKSGFPHFWFWFLLIAFFPLAILVLLLHMAKKADKCPICKKKVYA
jgi:hypothetical protein